jgi:hypothetical protein
MTNNHEVLADAVAGDAPRYQVFVLTAGRPRAVCECGWAGHKRLTAAGARVDAWLHAAEDGHMPATPLTLRPGEMMTTPPRDDPRRSPTTVGCPISRAPTPAAGPALRSLPAK